MEKTLSKPATGEHTGVLLFLASFLALYFELVIIRYLSTEVRVFAYVKNLPLIASFLGIGLGMTLVKLPRWVRVAFPVVSAALFLSITFAGRLHITHVPFPSNAYLFMGLENQTSFRAALFFYGVIFAVLALVVLFFLVLGGLVGEYLGRMAPLAGYGINLLGSLAGIGLYTLLSFWATPPSFWLTIGLLAALPFLFRRWTALLVLVGVLLAVSLSGAERSLWSPYYRITLLEVQKPAGWPTVPAYFLTVNHDYHQKMVDLSPQFLSRYPRFQPNASAYATYELPYWLVDQPQDVLVIGAGTGNDVAAALRHGAQHVDAVEIDPMIYNIGKKDHPEHPYSSPRVTIHINDARAYLKQATQKYDLIIYAYLDSHTLLTSYSSLRLENYVYTQESLEEARRLLKPNGTLILAFASGNSFVTNRLFAVMARVFGAPPLAYFTAYDTAGVVFVEGAARTAGRNIPFPEISHDLPPPPPASLLPTDKWPFLFLAKRQIPGPILAVLLIFIAAAAVLVRFTVGLGRIAQRENLHFFTLGAGFLLLETKGITELSLLFGSTWVVNAVVIGAFLGMALAANLVVLKRPISRVPAYVGLFLFTAVSAVFPYSILNVLSSGQKVGVAAVLVGLPVFFSGLIFSRSFRDTAQPAQALGVNLLGAVIGGAAENLVMIGGTPVLGYLALALYVASALAVPGRVRADLRSAPAAASGAASS